MLHHSFRLGSGVFLLENYSQQMEAVKTKPDSEKEFYFRANDCISSFYV